ncbi:MAG: hypothetical protein LBP21_10010 [Synergistaceae bacterium]|jgi:hypothetical protein|nr:hypothetical protein [Synergistaceae bacterium]
MGANNNKKKRQRRRDGSNWGFFKKTVYYAIVVILVMAVVEAYLLWLDNYNMLHPEVVAATAMGYVEELPLDGVLVWDERVVPAPREGVVTYLFHEPRRVQKGDTVAAIDGVAVAVDTPGYFSPILDGQEGKWVYAKLWHGFSQFPLLENPRPVQEGLPLEKGKPLGKLVPQPQDLRCIAYLDKTISLEQDIKRGFLEIKTEPAGKGRQAAVRASVEVGQKVKVYLTLPFFPPEILRRRTFSCSVLTGNRQGVALPHSAVVLREGALGVLMVKGTVTEFTQVEGFPADESNFFITKGVVPGNVVVLHADKVKEGVVRLW